MKNLTGIWIDKRTAKIATLKNEAENFQEVTSSIEEFHPKGGSGTRLKGGPQDVVQDSKYMEREKQQEKSYFKEIMDIIFGSDEIVIFGPAEMGKKLYSRMAESNLELYKKVKEVKPADSMTDNQIKAWVREYFHKDKKKSVIP